MKRKRRLPVCVALSVSLVVIAFPLHVKAETWTDTTGQFKIEAEFQGVTGSSVMLQKPDGSSVSVPIAKLSAASRDRAKALYEQQKSNNPIGLSARAVMTTENESPSVGVASDSTNTQLSGSIPEPPAVDPLPAFPENATLQQTVDFVADQLLAGHPEVWWHMQPAEIRDALDSENIRALAAPFLKEQALAGNQNEKALRLIVELLVTKKEFIVNSPLMMQIPPKFSPFITQAYDPTVGLLYELTQASQQFHDIERRTYTNILDELGPRVGGHLKMLIAVAPPEIVQTIRKSLIAKEIDATTGSVTLSRPDGKAETFEFAKYGNRWIPKSYADGWAEAKDDLEAQLTAGMEKVGDPSEASAMVGTMFLGMAHAIVTPLSQTSTQEEFDAAVGQAMQMAGGLRPGATDAGGAPGGF